MTVLTKMARPARIRALRTIKRELEDLDRKRVVLEAKRDRVLLADQEAEDRSTSGELAAALGIEPGSVRGLLQRIGERPRSSASHPARTTAKPLSEPVHVEGREAGAQEGSAERS